VPKLPVDDVQALVRRGADWSEMVGLIDTHAPYRFLIYFRNDIHRAVRRPRQCVPRRTA